MNAICARRHILALFGKPLQPVLLTLLVAAFPGDAGAEGSAAVAAAPVRWGASVDAVRASHTSPPKRDATGEPSQLLVYDSSIAGSAATLIYRFAGGKLFESRYHLKRTAGGCAAAARSFELVNRELSRSFAQEPASAAGTGCEQTVRWKTDDSDVVSHLGGTGSEIDHTVTFSSR